MTQYDISNGIKVAAFGWIIYADQAGISLEEALALATEGMADDSTIRIAITYVIRLEIEKRYIASGHVIDEMQ